MKRYLLVIKPALVYLLSAREKRLIPLYYVKNIPTILMLALLPLVLVCMNGTTAAAQQTQPVDTAYVAVVTERASKMVTPLQLSNEKKERVIREVANQYIALNKIHDASKAVLTGFKADATLSKEAMAAAVKKEEERKMTLLKQQHDQFIAQLQKDLSAGEIEKIKDGLTYSVLPKTYAAFLDMIPTLTEKQKKQIYDWLYEAREYAMDAESSEKKHGWFGKYKGKINNYLSAEGYNLQKEREGWEQRQKERANAR